MSSTHVDAPFTDTQVTSLNDYQASGVFHPYTCGEHSQHPDGVLKATTSGWRCRVDGCAYTQTWAHSFAADRSWDHSMDGLRPLIHDIEVRVAGLRGWDMLTLDDDGRGTACADAPWARQSLDEIAGGLAQLRGLLEVNADEAAGPTIV